jgi:alpha-ketoglutarate-dependent 2,4-dichlorophenoxyacetate dioxygenase
LTDISNVDEEGRIRAVNDRMRMFSLANRLWHTDASFQDPPGRYSMLHAKVVPPVRADTEFADMRAAYDALDESLKTEIENLRVHHSIAYSRQILGFELAQQEQDQLKGAVHPLVRTNPRTQRRSLYVASHATRIVDWPIPEGRLLLKDLMAHATQIAVRLRTRVACSRSCHLGQSCNHASRAPLRRYAVPTGIETRHDARPRSAGHQLNFY